MLHRLQPYANLAATMIGDVRAHHHTVQGQLHLDQRACTHTVQHLIQVSSWLSMVNLSLVMIDLFVFLEFTVMCRLLTGTALFFSNMTPRICVTSHGDGNDTGTFGLSEGTSPLGECQSSVQAQVTTMALPSHRVCQMLSLVLTRSQNSGSQEQYASD